MSSQCAHGFRWDQNCFACGRSGCACGGSCDCGCHGVALTTQPRRITREFLLLVRYALFAPTNYLKWAADQYLKDEAEWVKQFKKGIR